MKITQTIVINANIYQVFDLTQDYDKRKEWDALIGEISILTPLPIQKGTKLKYTAKNRLSMVVEYQNYNRPKIASIKMIEKSALLSHFGGGWRFEKIDETTTKIILAYSFECSVFPKLFNPIFAKIFKWENQKRFEKLKKYLEKINDYNVL